MISQAGSLLLRQHGKIAKPLRLSPVRNQRKLKICHSISAKNVGADHACTWRRRCAPATGAGILPALDGRFISRGHRPARPRPAADYKKPACRRRLKTERKMMKLKVQFGPETHFDQPIRRIARTPGAVFARHPGFVAHSGHRRTAEADQARIDLWIFLGDSNL